jgi:hypothetical protein
MGGMVNLSCSRPACEGERSSLDVLLLAERAHRPIMVRALDVNDVLVRCAHSRINQAAP